MNEGYVRSLGGDTGLVVIGKKVYEIVLGGQPSEVGFVKDGKAYMPVFGGDPTPIGDVVYR
jgi:hypothetical protein